MAKIASKAASNAMDIDVSDTAKQKPDKKQRASTMVGEDAKREKLIEVF